MNGAESLIQDNTSTSTSIESDSGGTGVSTQTDPVTSSDASTITSTQCVIHEATMTDMTRELFGSIGARISSSYLQEQWRIQKLREGGSKAKTFEATPTFCETFPIDCYPYTKEACPCAIYLVVYLRYLLDGSFGSLMARSVV